LQVAEPTTERADRPRTRGFELAADQLAVVIPARNEVRTLRSVAIACLAEVRTVIVVDDASTDGTLDAVADLPVIPLRSDRHLGKGGALTLGFRKALDLGVEAVITIDGDGQHDPHDIPAFIEEANARPGSLVVGARIGSRESAPLARRMANRIADFWISLAAGVALRDSQCGQRLYPRDVLLAVRPAAEPEDGFAFESEVLIECAWQGFGVATVPIETRYPADRRASHFRPGRDIWRITRMVARRILVRARPHRSRRLHGALD
jgi:glycosyltransferase involved in cell wall biosynthesis